jgi:NADH dehydrogenase FAD-containing subunit
LKRIEDAIEIRRRILLAFEQAENETDADERRRLINLVIVGGGPTGVELAGAIAELARRALAKDFRNIDPRAARIILSEAGPRVLKDKRAVSARFKFELASRHISACSKAARSRLSRCVLAGYRFATLFLDNAFP